MFKLNKKSTSFWTIGRKLGALLLVAITVSFAATVIVQSMNMKSNLYEEAVNANTHITKLLAIQVSGGLRWNQVEAIEGAYMVFAEDKTTNLASLVTYGVKGKPVTSFQSEKLPAHDLSKAAVKNEKALANNETIIEVTDRHIVVVTPVTAGKKKDRIGTLAIAWSLDAFNARVSETLFQVILLATVMVAALIGLSVFLINWIVTKPLTTMTSTMASLANDDLEVEIPALERRDEIGDMATTVQVFKDNMIKAKELAGQQKEAEKREREAEKREREAERRSDEERRQAEDERRQAEESAEREKHELMIKMADDFESSVGKVVETLSSSATEMQSSAQAMSSTAEETNSQSTTVATAAEQASANVQTVATAAEELSVSINEISRQVAQSSEIASNAVKDAQQTNERVQELAVAAEKIGEVVGLISDIAEQTNLLALNATIEAARAGDAGKGFAVVASEVKNLASQTATATNEIEAQISAIQSATQDAVEAIQGIGKTINEVNEIATTISAAVEEQSAATQEIARNVELAAAGTHEVTSNIAGVTQAAGETGQAAGQIQAAASELSQQSETLKGQVDKFLSEIRSDNHSVKTGT